MSAWYPCSAGKNMEIRPWLHFEHAPCYSKDQAFHALTDGRFKYVWRPNDGTEHLFDLDQDPREERDLSTDADNRDRLEQWRARLVQRLAQRPEGFSDGTQLIAGRPYPPVQHALDAMYGLDRSLMERFARHGIPIVDYHVHLRGGMTVDKAVERQAMTGIRIGVSEEHRPGLADRERQPTARVSAERQGQAGIRRSASE